MKPVKYAELIAPVATAVNLPVAVTGTVLHFFWQEVHQAMTSLSHHHITLRGHGTFTIKPSGLHNRLERRKAMLNRLAGTGKRTDAIRVHALDEISQLENVCSLMKEESIRKQAIKKTDQQTSQQTNNPREATPDALHLEKEKPDHGGYPAFHLQTG